MRDELRGVAEDSARRRGPWSRLGFRAAALVLLAATVPVASLIWASVVAKTEVEHRAFGGLTATALLMAVAAALGLLGVGIAAALGILVSRRTRRVELSEQALAISETHERRRLEQFMDAMPIGVFVATPDGHPFYANRAAEDLLGQPVVPEAGIGELARVYRAYVAGTDGLYPASRMPLVRALDAEASHVDDMEIRKPDGTVPVEVWGTPVLSPAGSVEFAITAFADVSERRRSAEELQLLGAITANMAEGVALIRLTDGTIVYVNASLESMFGYAAGEMVGMPIHELNAPNGATPQETARAITAAVVAEGSWQGEILSVRKDGSSFWSAINVSTFNHPALGPVSISVHTDITTRKAAQDAQAQLAAIVEASRDAIMEKSVDGIIRTWNQGAERLFGYRASEVIGRSVGMLIPAGSEGEEVQRRGWAAQGLGVEQFETVRVRKDGTTVDVSVTLSPIEGPHGKITGIAAICRDVTERRRAEAKFEGLLESAPDAIVVVGADGRIRLINRQTEVLFGYSRAELVGQPVERLIPDRLAQHHPDKRSHFFAHPSVRAMGATLDLAARRKDGSEFPVDISLAPLRTEEGVLVSAAVRDVTDRKRAQAALLEREEQLAAARDQALEASRLKSQFLANMSHEIRTPMNGVLGMAHLVLAGNLEPEQRRRVAKLVQSGQGLLTIINDILDFSKIEAGKLMLESEAFNLIHAAETIVGLLASAANAKGLTLDLRVGSGVPEWVNGDLVRIQQILTNILGNAIKFTERGGVEIAVTQAGAGGLRFEVHDTGVGIDPSLKARLLEPFTQADTSTTRRFGGTGLGLAICRQLVGLMGGELDFTSEPGVGTTFWFEVDLPAARGMASEGANTRIPNQGPPRRAVAGPQGGGRVLLVDDSDINREVGKGLLESVGYQVDAVGSGAEAVEAVRTGSYAAVLMDCLMPVMDGYEATGHIRTMEGDARHVSVIALTAAAMSGDRERCLAAGMDDYVSKPFELTTLVEALARCGLSLATSTAADDVAGVERPPGSQAAESGSGPLRIRLEFLASAMPAEVFDGICEQFLSSTPALLGDLAAAVGDDDTDAVRALAHKLRGSMATFGAGRLSDLAGRVEAGAGSGGAGLEHLLGQMGQEFTRARAVVVEVLSQRRSP